MGYIASQFGNPRGLVGKWIGWLMAIKNNDRIDWTCSQLGVRPGDRLIEIGYGPGVAIEKLIQSTPQIQIVGIDHSETMFAQAYRRNLKVIQTGQVTLHVGTVAPLPLADCSFHKALTINSSFFWPDPVEGFRELLRVLKPEGKIAVTVQPFFAKTDDQFQKAGTTLVSQLREAGFQLISLDRKHMRPVDCWCAIGLKKRIEPSIF
ncbi:MAG TPA: methyltransferase domain-containing protein [Acidobacteriota bacterium]|nr:methyltransferase domain-containing protein [Acidobacteriota bacterium]HMZ80046.1 methyltransferase domain-containing protein [Acidobacteriota bacterium]HNB72727.1 methyltransferase domain-containing protein [Acidobacteriota bacterium]HNC44884.1 methyltransferase domain-containing protein [Acidobacteriota bacterium]HND20647.1 methyltransferase domain-containing protein [Acidobacteriota bacterium]